METDGGNECEHRERRTHAHTFSFSVHRRQKTQQCVASNGEQSTARTTNRQRRRGKDRRGHGKKRRTVQSREYGQHNTHTQCTRHSHASCRVTSRRVTSIAMYPSTNATQQRTQRQRQLECQMRMVCAETDEGGHTRSTCDDDHGKVKAYIMRRNALRCCTSTQHSTTQHAARRRTLSIE